MEIVLIIFQLEIFYVNHSLFIHDVFLVFYRQYILIGIKNARFEVLPPFVIYQLFSIEEK
jgi:hypothetical protein